MSQVREEIGYTTVKNTRDPKEDPRSLQEIRASLGWQRGDGAKSTNPKKDIKNEEHNNNRNSN